MVGAEARGCVSCGHALAADAVFCPACGTRQPTACASCGAELEDGARFCSRCGAPVGGAATPAASTDPGPVAERRWASVLFADLVGFTTLSESRDPERVRELLSGYFDRCRQIIASYDGVVEKFIGDAVMAVWGVPTAHEDDAERAVRAGVALAAMVAALGEPLGADLALRVGVVTGEVAATLGAAGQGMVAGDPVNTAARVQTAAEPGRVYVDEETRTLTAAVVDYDDTGEHTLKGKAEPRRLYAVRSIRSEPAAVSTVRAPMVGRDHELAVLREVYASVVEQRRPRLVVLDGEAGVGKSRLVEEFQAWLEGLDTVTRWHRGRCLSYGEGVTFRALAEAVRTRLGASGADPADVVTGLLGRWLTAHALGDEVARLDGCLRVLLSIPNAPRDFSREQLFSSWVRFFEIVGSGQPVVLVIDDAHHADDGLLDFVEQALGVTRTPMLILAMARPELLERRPGWGGRRAVVVPLGPLGADAMSALVTALVPGLRDADRDALVARTGGVPLFAVETMRAMVDTGDADPATVGVEVSALTTSVLDAVDAPASLRSLIRSRLDSLDEPERRLVADGSVLGLSFSRDALAALAPDHSDRDAALATLLRREILTLDDDPFSPDRGQLRFTHAVVRHVAYSTLSRRDRKTRHLAAADYIATQQNANGELDALIAQHLLDALKVGFDDDPDRPAMAQRAASLLVSAASRSEQLGAPGQARLLLEKAATLTSQSHDAAVLRARAGRMAGLSGDPSAGIALAESAFAELQRTGSIEEVGAAAASLALCLKYAQQSSRILDLGREWVDRLLADDGAREYGIQVLEEMYFSAMNLGLDDERDEYVARVIALGSTSNDPVRMFFTELVAAESATMTRDEDTARLHYTSALSMAPEHGALPVHAAYLQLAILVQPDDSDEALALVEQAVEEARRRGLVLSAQWCLPTKLEFQFNRGDFTSLAATLDDLDLETVDGSARALIVAWAALHGWATGAEPRDWCLDDPAPGYAPQAAHGFTEWATALWRRDPVHAIEQAHRLLALMLTLEGRSVVVSLMPLWLMTAASTGDAVLAERILDYFAMVDLQEARPLDRAVGWWARGCLAPLMQGSDGVDELRRAIPELDSYGARAYAALARLDLAERLGTDSAEASAVRSGAIATLQGLGAFGWIPR